jgi:hypothetical protein
MRINPVGVLLFISLDEIKNIAPISASMSSESYVSMVQQKLAGILNDVINALITSVSHPRCGHPKTDKTSNLS